MRRRQTYQLDLKKSASQWLRDLFGSPPFIGIDLGSINIRIFLEDRGIILKEKVFVVKNKTTNEYIIAGDEAYEMLGKTPPNLEVQRPIERGRVSDFDGVEFFLNKVIKKALEPYQKSQFIKRYHLIFVIPLGLTEVEEMAVVEVGKKIGAKEVLLVETPLATGFGIKAPILENTGTFIVDVGGGTTEVSLMALGGVVLYKVIKVGGTDFNQAIINYLRLRYGLLIGEKTAEDIKLSLDSIINSTNDLVEVSGRSIETGMPKSINIKKKLLYEPLYPYFGQIMDLIREAIEETPPELVKDINRKGIILSGMSVNFPDLDKYFNRELKLTVNLCPEPEFSVIRGLGWLISHQDVLKKVSIKFDKI